MSLQLLQQLATADVTLNTIRLDVITATGCNVLNM